MTPAPSNDNTYERIDAARNLWRRCQPIENTHAQAYLRARAIHRCRFPALRFHPSLAYRDDTGRWRRFPALIAAVHRTWLDPDRPVKARIDRPRKALGHVHGRAVRFGQWDSGSTLLVGEGIETVLSLVTASPDTIAAAALSAGSLGSFVPPPGLSRLLIAQDRDDRGQRAALRLQMRCTRLGIASAVIVPQGNDFNDDLVTLGRQRLAQRLAPLAIRPRTGKRCGFADLQGTKIPLSNKRTPT